MAASILIKNLGPIQECKMLIDDFMVLTGAQASGKSTIAKCVYLCRTIKDDFLELLLRDIYLEDQKKLIKNLKSVLRNKFLRMFGTSLAMSADMEVKYFYSDDIYVRLSIQKNDAELDLVEKFVFVEFSKKLKDGLSNIIQNRNNIPYLERSINELFCDEYKVIYIPAGRSLISLLTSQLNYLYATMDDRQKRMIDYTTQRYIEYILKIRPSFSNGLEGLLVDTEASLRKNAKTMINLIKNILKGRYVYKDGTELLYIPEYNSSTDRYVKINFTSSGQQETVWIFNILFYLLVNQTKAFVILEEPEAHLYPDAQKKTAEILSYIYNSGCQMMITTHSPYVLGALNNLIYAGYIAQDEKKKNDVNRIIDQKFFIDRYSAFQVYDGKVKSCIEDTNERLIINEVIDDVSSEINELYDQLFDIENE